MFIRATSLFFALLIIVSCSSNSSEKEEPAPVDKLVGSWSVSEKVTFNEFTGTTFVTTTLPTDTYNATVTKVSPTTIKIEGDRSKHEYDLSATLTVDWDEQTISVPGAVVSGEITDENHFTVTHMWAISAGYYDVVRTFSR